jgi:hypothetical protein
MEWKNPSPVHRLTDTLSPGRGLSFLARVEVRKTAALGERARILISIPLPWGEGGPRPALSPAGAGRVRGRFPLRED